MEKDILSTLQLDDYMLANYVDSRGRFVNVYVAYSASQTISSNSWRGSRSKTTQRHARS